MLKGPIRILLKEMNVTFYINLIITIALVPLYIFISMTDNTDNFNGVLFGPFYVILFIFPFVVFKCYQYILSLGGTRKQFMLSLLVSLVFYLILCALILNVLYFNIQGLLQSGNIVHMAETLDSTSYILYFWVDILWMFLLFAIGLLIQVIHFNFGTLKTFIIAGVLLITSTAIYFLVDLTPLVEFIFNDYLLFLNLTGVAAVIIIIFSYFMMRNAPLERGDIRVFGKHVMN